MYLPYISSSVCYFSLIYIEPVANRLSTKGASPRELLLESCRRNNTSLLNELLSTLGSPVKIAELLNTATDGVGGYCLHIAASYGSCMSLTFLFLVLTFDGVLKKSWSSITTKGRRK